MGDNHLDNHLMGFRMGFFVGFVQLFKFNGTNDCDSMGYEWDIPGLVLTFTVCELENEP